VPSFSIQLADLEQEGPVIEVELAVPVVADRVSAGAASRHGSPVSASAMIDTGATATVIKQELVERLDLTPVGTVLINTPSSTRVECYQYLLRLVLPNSVAVEVVGVGAPLEGQTLQCLIGRDVLRRSVLIYTGPNNTVTLCC
jgi:predicted aspartyl protease